MARPQILNPKMTLQEAARSLALPAFYNKVENGSRGEATMRRACVEVLLNENDATSGGKINLTRLGEMAAQDLGHNEWLDDETHAIWEIVVDVADAVESRAADLEEYGEPFWEASDLDPDRRAKKRPGADDLRPDWASAMGRDRRGLWAEVDSIVRARWELTEAGDASAEPITEARGVWSVESWPEWARAAGWDGREAWAGHGFWLEVAVEDVVLRLRWIAPGRFLMGSPETEAGREAHEGPRHEVTLSRGFWLAETPCTQALWQAVTGDNPSRFRSPDRPVEQVSWQDCREFLEALDERVPGLEARLPTEAEWEYACRAGTESGTYAGELEILGACNAPLLDKIGWYSGNSGVDFELENGDDSSGWPEQQYPHESAGTHPVARKAPNAWGLFDMLGNVWEWCEDAWDYGTPYSAGAARDPVAHEGSLRVLRGGSWGTLARLVRSAARYAWTPRCRFEALGFRLARGQGRWHVRFPEGA